MNVVLWIIQIILAALFLTAGSLKLVLPKERLERAFEWVDDYSQSRLKLIGAFEVLGALGLFLPGVYSLATIFIPLSALGLSLIMALAAALHLRRFEKSEFISKLAIIVFLMVIIIGRLAIL